MKRASDQIKTMFVNSWCCISGVVTHKKGGVSLVRKGAASWSCQGWCERQGGGAPRESKNGVANQSAQTDHQPFYNFNRAPAVGRHQSRYRVVQSERLNFKGPRTRRAVASASPPIPATRLATPTHTFLAFLPPAPPRCRRARSDATYQRHSLVNWTGLSVACARNSQRPAALSLAQALPCFVSRARATTQGTRALTPPAVASLYSVLSLFIDGR